MARARIFGYSEGIYLKIFFSILTFLQPVVAENVDVEIYVPPLEFIDRLEGYWKVDIVEAELIPPLLVLSYALGAVFVHFLVM